MTYPTIASHVKSKHIRADASVATGHLPNTNASNIICPKKLHLVLILHAWFGNFNNSLVLQNSLLMKYHLGILFNCQKKQTIINIDKD